MADPGAKHRRSSQTGLNVTAKSRSMQEAASSHKQLLALCFQETRTQAITSQGARFLVLGSAATPRGVDGCQVWIPRKLSLNTRRSSRPFPVGLRHVT
eukprot:1761200-Alexandrium_andersonii.AAC.1